jgi:hypothetical protein
MAAKNSDNRQRQPQRLKGDRIVRDKWQQEAEAGNLRAAIVEYIRLYDWVTFPELQRKFEPYMDVRGHIGILMEKKNIVFWGGLSQELADLIVALDADGAIRYEPASPLAYLVDGGLSTLPLVRRPPRNGYKHPHWLPVCLRLEDEYREAPPAAGRERGPTAA